GHWCNSCLNESGTIDSDAAKLSTPVQVLQWKRVRNSGNALSRRSEARTSGDARLPEGGALKHVVIPDKKLSFWRNSYAHLDRNCCVLRMPFCYVVRGRSVLTHSCLGLGACPTQ